MLEEISCKVYIGKTAKFIRGRAGGRQKQIRLNKAIAQSGLASRRNADALIAAGKVMVNGKLVTKYSFFVAVDDDIMVNGKKITISDFKYLLFYKPTGYITTKKDERGRKIVYDLLPNKYSILRTAGRLDRDSEGLLLLSNDGNFLNTLEAPKNKVTKSYLVTLEIKITNADFESIKLKMLKGIHLDGVLCSAVSVKLMPNTKDKKQTVLEIVLHEGRNRQIRRMLQIIGFTVSKLKRIQIAGFDLRGLKPGGYREINKKEAYANLYSK